MKKKSRPSNKLANLTFYNPREEEFSPEKNTINDKSQKFYRAGTSKGPLTSKSVTSPQFTSHAIHRRQMSQTGGDFSKEMITLDHDASVTAPTVQTVQEGLDLSPIRIMHGNSQSFGVSKIYKFSDKSLEKLPSNIRLRDSTDRSLEKTYKESNKTQDEIELSKIYKSAHLFQNLKFTREKDEIARIKLSEDKAANVSAQLDAVRADVSHIFNYRPARIKTPSQKLLPDMKERQGTGLSKIFKESGSGTQYSGLDTSSGFEKRNNSVGHTLSSSMGPGTPMKILDNNLQESKFFIPTSTIAGQKSLLFGSLQRDIHSVQSPLSRNMRSQAKSSNDRSADKIEYMQTTMTAFDTGEYSPYQSLKKEIPSVFTNAPANRQELVQLGTWLNSTLKGIKENTGYTDKEKFYKADEIYNICFNELIRQVSVECMERGELLMVVWKAYLSLAEDIIEDIKLREDKAEEKGQKEVEKVHKMYNDILGVKEKLIEDQQKKIDEFDLLVKELNEKIAGFDEKEAVKSNEISKLKEGITKAKKNYMHIQQEQRDLQYKYNRLKKNFDQIDEESLPEHFMQRKESLNFSFSSDSDDKPAKEATAFGNPRHKIIRYAEKSVMYEPPMGLGDMSTQTDLVLASERFDRIFQSQNKMENLLLDDIAKSKLIHSAEMMENMSDKNKRKSRREGATKSEKEDVSKNVTVDDFTIAEEDFAEGEGLRKESMSNSDAVTGDILNRELLQNSNQGSLLINDAVAGNKNTVRSRASKTKSITRKDKGADTSKEISQEVEDGDREDSTIVEEGEQRKGKGKSVERAKEKKQSTKIQTSSPTKEAQSGVTSQNRSPAKNQGEGKVEASNKAKTVKSNVSQKNSGTVKRTGKAGYSRAEGEDGIEDEDGRGNSRYEIKLTEEIVVTERDAQGNVRDKKRNTDGSFMTDTGIAKSGTAGSEARNRDNRKNSRVPASQFALQENNGDSGSGNKRVDKKSYTMELGLLGLAELDPNVDNFAERQEDRIIQLMNMYKIEKQKQEELNEANRDLESQAAKNKTTIKNLQELVEELQKRLDSGENNKETLKRNDSRKVTVIDETKRKLGHSGTMQMSDSSSTKNLMNLNDSNMDFLQQAAGFRSNISISVASVLARKNQMLDKRNFAWQAMLMKAQKAIQAKSANNIVDTMPLKSLLKQITSFYAEKIQLAKDSPVTREQDMATFVYKQFLHTYGFQQFAMRKFLKFMDSVKKYSNIHRVGLFARMLCIASDETNYPHDEVKQYLMGTEYLMTNSTVGVYYPNSDHDRRHFVAYIRAVEYTRVFGDKRMPLEELLEMKRVVDARKMFDPTGRNPQGVVDMDEVLEKVVEKYKELIEQSKEVLKPVFMAGDPYGSKGIVYIEFAMLYRTIEGEKHDEKKVEDAFASNCDVIVNGEIALSFEKFVRVCFELELFSKKAQESFLGILNQQDLEAKLNELRVKWRKEKLSMLELIEKNKPYVPQEVGVAWNSALIWIEDKIRMADSGIEQQVAMLKYKVLCKDLTN